MKLTDSELKTVRAALNTAREAWLESYLKVPDSPYGRALQDLYMEANQVAAKVADELDERYPDGITERSLYLVRT